MRAPNRAHPPAAADLPGARWHRSSHSGSNNNCVERGVLASGDQAVRDTKDRARGVLLFPGDSWRAFVTALARDRPPHRP
ncbi:DUF397 domain-containing protein [Streptomyces profundus]|uniref:DUF397 domain-containing protein n=1 Tax=Streptomyces profundus TaxID=2867410 RepID=UPI001D16795F|nr:DUF397 domain-containing protein [Streptomyces sp. MA3_2.13]UED87381.1 DUF397 domain-containing protein [Streptomyces sp. MA3_2.13]